LRPQPQPEPPRDRFSDGRVPRLWRKRPMIRVPHPRVFCEGGRRCSPQRRFWVVAQFVWLNRIVIPSGAVLQAKWGACPERSRRDLPLLWLGAKAKLRHDPILTQPGSQRTQGRCAQSFGTGRKTTRKPGPPVPYSTDFTICFKCRNCRRFGS
jgi:hypothetical protein